MQQLPYSDILLQLIASGTFDVDPTNPNSGVNILSKLKKEFAAKHKLKDIPTNIQLIKAYRELVETGKIRKDIKLEQLLKKRGIRSQSGIVSVQVLTKPWPCPGKCIFCPSEKNMPKSYISSEPGAMRAALNNFDPIKQVYNRLHSLSVTGHETDKIEMIVLGGTFDCYTKEYKVKFVKQLYDACNAFSELKISDPDCHTTFAMTGQQRYKFDISNLKTIRYSKTLAEAIKKNETAKNRIIGLTIETRPEFVTDQNCMFWRELGVTRIEMGVQSLDDEVLKLNKRGNTVAQIREAFDTMRRRGFKISVHIMPGLYGSNYAKDLKTFKDLYTDPFLKPDEIKFYPTSVIPHTKLAELYKKGEYTPLETDDIKKLIRQTFLEVIPPYTRIKRLIRDIPANEIVAGSKITNLGQLMHTALQEEQRRKGAKVQSFYKRLWPNVRILNSKFGILNGKHALCHPEMEAKDLELDSSLRSEGHALLNSDIQTFILGGKPDLKTLRNFVCLDTRSREIRNKTADHRLQTADKESKTLLVIRKYTSSVGDEYFISYEDELGYLYGFCRLLLPKILNSRFGILNGDAAMIRELHVYGNVRTIDGKNDRTIGKKNDDVQHTGFGKRLMQAAETLAKQGKYKRISVISGVGVRGYYKKLGYRLHNTYMVKKI